MEVSSDTVEVPVKTDEVDQKVTNDEEEEEEDLEAELAKETASLKDDKGKQRFNRVNCGAQNLTFVKTTVPEPVRLATNIVEHIRDTQQQRGRQGIVIP